MKTNICSINCKEIINLRKSHRKKEITGKKAFILWIPQILNIHYWFRNRFVKISFIPYKMFKKVPHKSKANLKKYPTSRNLLFPESVIECPFMTN